jgi:hypothetical protein
VKKWGELGRQALTIAGLSVKGALSRSQSTAPSRPIFEFLLVHYLPIRDGVGYGPRGVFLAFSGSSAE